MLGFDWVERAVRRSTTVCILGAWGLLLVSCISYQRGMDNVFAGPCVWDTVRPEWCCDLAGLFAAS
ncbi:hypothetical protein BDW42DRAFT_159903 [Aspergillus taichungensis]|uniref:Uncharacterized protein n=1 Tax=Aspergillus taichungensis TaxID=482145 RepID=A0A2J5I7G7_9EURO|nr:hypothetical protein BDW42DRAFT_159903 [Aspergillus taichungensis]